MLRAKCELKLSDSLKSNISGGLNVPVVEITNGDELHQW